MTENTKSGNYWYGCIITYWKRCPNKLGKCLKGVNGIDTITRVDTEEYNVHLAGELKDFNIEDHISKRCASHGSFYTICSSSGKTSCRRC